MMTYNPAIHFYEDENGMIHLCAGSHVHRGIYLIWTLCEFFDVPAGKSFLSNMHVADCLDCRRKAGLQL